MRIAVIQLALREEPEEVIKDVEGLLNIVNKREPDIALLPEAWISRDPLNNLDRAVVGSEVALERLRRLAVEHGVVILGGGLYIPREGKVSVSCPVIDTSGEIVGSQEKVHLFRGENKVLQKGESLKTFTVKGVEIGVLICHDIVYPEAARTLVLAGAQILFNPARIVSHGREAWQLYLKVRSLENRIPIYAANIWSPPKYTGGTCAVKPVKYLDEVYLPELIEARQGLSAIVDEVDIEALSGARRERLVGRMPHTYLDSQSGEVAGDLSWVRKERGYTGN
ncbi:MAG: carbon-nitrogen hydrolase family protein [Nitrososphaerota archaeon]